MAVETKLTCVGSGYPYIHLDDDDTLTANAEDRVPTQEAVVAYVAARIALAAAGDLQTGKLLNPDGIIFAPADVTASGVLPNSSFVRLDSATSLAVTSSTATAGRLLIVTQKDTGTAGHTLTLSGCTFDGTNTIATFNAPGETLVLFALSSTRYAIILNLGSVALSNA